MSRKPVPVVVLAGFLGSGKTTLLNHLLRQSRGTRIGAVVNDFGAIEIDAMTVAGQVDSMVSLGDGCLCCAVDTSELDEYLGRLSRPDLRIDVIVIEASGLAEPQELIRMILASDNPDIVYGGLVQVVDAAEFDATRSRHPETDRHLTLADLVVLNKADRVDEAGRARIRAAVGEHAVGVPVVSAAYGQIDPGLLIDRRPAGERVGQLSFDDLRDDVHDDVRDDRGPAGTDTAPAEAGSRADDGDHSGHLHALYESVGFVSAEPMNPRRLMEFLDARPDGLYRIKGFVHFGVPGHPEKYTLHAVGNFLRFYPSPRAEGEETLTELVLIGSGIDTEAVRARLDGCREHAPQDVPAESMWGVLRYVPGLSEGPGEPDGTEEAGLLY
ncbi:GTP-binding protein [Streptomyces sp. NBC_01306]|uniref:CobW family GTP-binding protein n=1 Tax=Streptomyces sp. NBC_01306 TaxID=2903819 RepID=UPI0022535F3F|nr:CobW family GTP-binding protein [Streptomyces sp. NBC_01306]MCX4723284.1 GTP-binding protein [Streptomyces sp. NBC_01306]